MADSVTTITTRSTRQRTPKAPPPRSFWDPDYYADPRNANAAQAITPFGLSMTEAQFNLAHVRAMASMFTPQTERALLDVLAGSPTISPGVAVSLTALSQRFQLPQEMTDEILTLDAEVKAGDPALYGGRKPDPGSEAERGGLSSVLGGLTRPLFALASMPYELVQGAMRSLAGDIIQRDEPGYQRESFGEEMREIFSQTLGGQFIAGLVTPQSADLGGGYVPRGEVAERQRAEARRAAPLVHGHAWTLGRGVGSVVFDDPDSLAYRNLSGFVDLAAALTLDPLILVGKPAAAARALTRTARETALAEVGNVSRETLSAAVAFTKDSQLAHAAAARGRGGAVANTDEAELAAHLDDVLDRTDVARFDAAVSRETSTTDATMLVDDARTALGDDGLDAMTADVVSKAPELPGVFTAAEPMVGPNRVLPGSYDGIDAIVRYEGPVSPNLRSVDDPLDDPAGLAASVGSQLGRSKDRTRGISALTTAVNKPDATYSDVIQVAIDNRVTGPLYNALRESDIDGITDVFRLTDNEAGIWWTGRDMTVVRAEGDDWALVDLSAAGTAQRLERLGDEAGSVTRRLDQVSRKRNTMRAVQDAQAARYEGNAARLDENALDPNSVRAAVEHAMGVRRRIDGKPEFSTELIRDALVNPRAFDEAVRAHAQVPRGLRAAAAADRVFTGLFTLGASEAARHAGRALVDPFLAKTRDLVLSEMVRLDDTPLNLGRLQRVTNGKVPTELLRGVLQARTEDEVLAVLGPALGVDITRPLDASALTAGRLRVSQVGTGRSVDSVFRKGTRWLGETIERQRTIAPRVAVHLNLADPDSSAPVLRNYLTNLPRFSAESTDRIIGDYLAQGTDVGRAKVVRRAMDTVADELAEWTRDLTGPIKASKSTAQALRQALRRATRLYDSARADVNDWWTNKYAHDSSIGYMTVDGQLIPVVGPQLEAELARGGMVLPDMRELRDTVGRWGVALRTVPGLKRTRNALDYGLDLWRSSVLFRFAYTVRNIGEMQFRMWLSGHRSVFNHPLGAAAMASALNKRTTFSRGLAARFASYNRTATGKRLGAVGSAELDATDDALQGYLELMARSGSRHDMRSMRAAAGEHDVREVRYDQPEFTQGWADQLIMLHSDRLARIVAGFNPSEIEAAIARGVDRKTAVVDWLLNSSGANHMRREFREAGPDYVRIFDDPQALRQYLFDSPASIEARVHEYTMGGDPELLDLIRTGELRRGEQTLFTFSGRGLDPQLRQELMTKRTTNLAGQLSPYLDTAPEDMKLRMRVYTPGRDRRNLVDRAFDTFFDWNGRKENAWAMGPEFSYAFHDSLARLMPAMDQATRDEVFGFIRKAEGFRADAEIMLTARAAMKSPPGSLNMDDVERVAAREASEHVKTLFYDARDRSQFFHMMRLVWPFGQPFVNTLSSWGRLLSERPYKVEQVGRLAQGATEEGSGVIYDDFDWIDPFTDRQSRDPTQGFVYTHPETGESMFSFPLIGSALGAIISPAAGFNAAESMRFTAPVESLNLAFQGDIDYLPGLGPMLSVPLSLIMPDDAYGTIPEWLRSYAFPFGEPNLEGGVAENVLLPTWARRMWGALVNEDFRAYSYRGLLPYFASTREYPGLASDPAAQQQLVDDVQDAGRWLTFIRAVGAAFLPASPQQDIYAADKDGRLIGTVYLADRFRHLKDEYDGDYEAATAAFMKTYGEAAIAAIVPNTQGELPITGPGWEFYRKHASKAAPYMDIIGAFFPGDYSYEAQRFQLDSRSRERLSVEERKDKLLGFLYNAERAQLEARGAMEEWDTEQQDEAMALLKQSYGGVLPAFQGEDSRTKLDKIRRALTTFPELADTRGGEGAALLFEAYDTYSEQSELRYGSGLASKKASMLRQLFLDELDDITSQYGGHGDARGSVDTIAGYFVRAVQPRS